MLNYCQALGVELQVEVNTCRASLLQNDLTNAWKPITQRHAINDMRGHISALLSKCVAGGQLDHELSTDDRRRLLDFLNIYGPLDKERKYVGSDRAGYAKLAQLGHDVSVVEEPIPLHTLLVGDFWLGMLWEEVIFMQATMFQPVGGMDRIAFAFAKSLEGFIRYDSPTTSLRKTTTGVRVEYTQNGASHAEEADFCICALPLTSLKKIPNDFSQPIKHVIDTCTYVQSYKVAWESRRFWEQDYRIYGGLEFLNQGCSPVWFPSSGYFSPRGVLVSGYADEIETGFDKLSVEQKFQASRKAIEKLHPGHGRELEKPVYVGWGKVPYQEGSWIASYGPLASGEQMTPGVSIGQPPTGPGYNALLEADGPLYLAGDHVSRQLAWQEGAAQSAIHAVQRICDRVKSRSHA